MGVAKRLLCGILQDHEVLVDGKKVGFALLAHSRVKNPVYVSPGHRISYKSSIAIAKHFSQFRIPAPLKEAHILATETLRNAR
jgi:deoxyribonuclease V